MVSRSNFCGLLNKAWTSTVTSDNIVFGFRSCGIFPFHPNAIPDEAYLPSLMYAAEEGVGRHEYNYHNLVLAAQCKLMKPRTEPSDTGLNTNDYV